MRLIAIDPGPELSAYVVYSVEKAAPMHWGKVPNSELLERLSVPTCHALAIEMIASYGMAVGKEVFETCVWIGRFIERWSFYPRPLTRVTRKEVALHLCNSPRANDSNLYAALIDRYGPGKEKAVGKKASPGPLYKMNGDCRAALGVAITATEDPGHKAILPFWPTSATAAKILS